MTKYRKLYLYALGIAVICVPIFVNFLCLTVFPAPIVGDGKLWLNFWGSFIGGMLPVLTAIYVLDEEHKRDSNRKDYEIQNEFFNSLCVDMGKLCSVIDIDILCFYLMSMKRIEDAKSTILDIGRLEKVMNCEYNEFSLKYAHFRGYEGEIFLNTYYNYSKTISDQISIIQKAVVGMLNHQVDESVYNATISRVCNDLEKLGDIRLDLLLLAEKWKKREFEITEQKRKKYQGE